MDLLNALVVASDEAIAWSPGGLLYAYIDDLHLLSGLLSGDKIIEVLGLIGANREQLEGQVRFYIEAERAKDEDRGQGQENRARTVRQKEAIRTEHLKDILTLAYTLSGTAYNVSALHVLWAMVLDIDPFLPELCRYPTRYGEASSKGRRALKASLQSHLPSNRHHGLP